MRSGGFDVGSQFPASVLRGWKKAVIDGVAALGFLGAAFFFFRGLNVSLARLIRLSLIASASALTFLGGWFLLLAQGFSGLEGVCGVPVVERK